MKTTSLIVLVLVMLLTMLAACSSIPTDTTPPAESTTTTAEPTPTETLDSIESTESPAEDPVEEPAETPDEPTVEEPVVELNNVQLPIVDEPTTFTGWITDAVIMTNAGQEKFEENHVLLELEKRTNVYWEWETAPSGSSAEKFNLMIISGDWSDMFITGTYTGGFDKFIDDEVILDLYDLVEEHAPNYNAIYHNDESIRRELMTDGGHMPTIKLINYTFQPTFLGWFARQDWMDALGIEKLETFADWETYLAGTKETYGASGVYLSATDGQDLMISGGYGVNDTFIAVDGQVKFSPVEQGYYDYLAMLADWYNKGYVDKDFAGRQSMFTEFTYFTDGTFALYPHLYTFYDMLNVMGKGSDPAFEATAVPFPVKNSGDPLLIKSFSALPDTLLGGTTACLSATCSDPVTIIKWFDYLFTDEGAFLCNWGVEGDAHTMNGDEVVVSDIIVANPDGLAYNQIKDLLIMPSQIPFRYLWERELASGVSDAALDCAYTWYDNWDIPNQYTLSTSVSLTTEESEDITTHVSDINTYVEEFTAKVIIGEESLDNWDTYVQHVYDMGLEDAIACYQAAYDRYLQR